MEEGKDIENETKASSVVQKPVDQGVSTDEATASASRSREERDLERGSD